MGLFVFNLNVLRDRLHVVSRSSRELPRVRRDGEVVVSSRADAGAPFAAPGRWRHFALGLGAAMRQPAATRVFDAGAFAKLRPGGMENGNIQSSAAKASALVSNAAPGSAVYSGVQERKPARAKSK
jgi:hypothetical protein